MEFRDYFDVGELFTPLVYYDGDVLFGVVDSEGFVLNSKQKNGKNLYLEFIEKYYYKPVSLIMDSVSLSKKYPPIIESRLDDNGKRVTTFSLAHFVFSVMRGLVDCSKAMDRIFGFNSTYTSRDLINILREELILDRKKYNDVKTNGKSSMYYNEIYELFTLYDYKEGFLSFLESSIRGKTKMIVGCRYFLDFFNKEVKTDELVGCFDYDKFCLLAARFILDNSLISEKSDGLIHNSITYVKRYLEAVSIYKRDFPDYECSVVSNDCMTGKRCVYTISDIQKEYNALLARHPEHNFISVSLDRARELLKTFGYDDEFIENFDYSTVDVKEFSKVLEMINDSKSLLASWKIIPKGKWEKEVNLSDGLDYDSSISDEEAIRRMLYSKQFFESSNYLFRIEGINQFEGYSGYIYPNGRVCFEKHYEDVSKKKVAKSCATYVTDLENLVSVSKMTKPQIIMGIKSGQLPGVKRHYHVINMDKWGDQVKQSISGDDYTEQIIDYIGGLVDSQVVSKRGDHK